MTNIKIATWNICLGMPNKKDIVTDYLRTEEIKVCCLQETEVQADFPADVLNTGGYTLELALNDTKCRSGIYISNEIKYVRRLDLELKNYHIVVCDLEFSCPVRVVCMSRKGPGSC